MTEPFKNFFNPGGVRSLAGHLTKHDRKFEERKFVDFILRDFDRLELKQRSDRITDALQTYLPDDFPTANSLLLKTLHPDETGEIDVLQKKSQEDGISGWMVMPMAQFVANRGRDHFDVALASLKEMTKRFSSEFAIRYFIDADADRTLGVLAGWVNEDNVHVRRLVSEGTRSRLPWGIRLQVFVVNPEPVLPLLERLRDDPEEYVRRSVANNLNDISKDHPDLIAQIAGDWLKGASNERSRLVRHACRSLIKAGHPECLKALGYGKPKVTLEGPAIRSPQVRLGEALDFTATITSTSQEDQPLILDYVVHHRKANRSLTPKVFKLKTITLKARETVSVKRRHSLKVITTRTYYPGRHRLEIQINGVVLGGADFILEV